MARKVRGLFEVSGQDQTGKLNTVRSEVSLTFSDYGEPVIIHDPSVAGRTWEKEQTLWSSEKQSNPGSKT